MTNWVRESYDDVTRRVEALSRSPYRPLPADWLAGGACAVLLVMLVVFFALMGGF